MPNCYGYCRISKGRETQAYSLDAQTEAIKAYHGYKFRDQPDVKLILPLFKDQKTSGKNVKFKKRVAGAALMGRVRAGDHIIVAKADRAFRSNQDQFETMAMFAEAGVIMHFVDLQIDTSTVTGKFILTVIVAFAEMEHGRLVERTKEALAARKFLNMAMPRKAPVGWTFVFQGEGRPRKPKPDLKTREIANRALRLAEKGLTHLEIAEEARRQRWVLPKSFRFSRRAWSEKYIKRLVKAATFGFPISDKEAENNLELPQFELEEGDTPVMPGGTVFQPELYPAAGPLKPTED